MSTESARGLGTGPLRRLVGAMSLSERALVGAVALLSAAPASGHYSPGAAGYLWATAVLAAALAWTRPSLADPLPWTRLLTAQGMTVIVLYVVLLGWAALSLLWSATPSRTVALLALGLSAAAALLPLAALRQPGIGHLLTARVASLVAVTCSVPLAAYQQLGLPGARLSLPLGAGSTYPVPMILAVAVLAVAASERGPARPVWISGTTAGATLVVLSGSRVGIAMLVALGLVATLLLASRPARRRLATGMAAGWVVFLGFATWYLPRVHNAWYVPRLSSLLSDPGRRVNARGALDAWTETPWSVLLGQGEQSVWPWLATEMASGGSGPFVRETTFGPLLYHPHSTYLAAAAELGLVGLGLWLALALAVLWGCRAAARRSPGDALVALALVLSLIAMALDYHLRRDFPGALLWWTVALLGPLSRRSRPDCARTVTSIRPKG